MKGVFKMTKGIKKSVGEFNRWQGVAKIMYDIDSGIIWTDVFSSNNEWKEYNSGVITIQKKGSIPQENSNKVTMKKIERKVELAKEYYGKDSLEYVLDNFAE